MVSRSPVSKRMRSPVESAVPKDDESRPLPTPLWWRALPTFTFSFAFPYLHTMAAICFFTCTFLEALYATLYVDSTSPVGFIRVWDAMVICICVAATTLLITLYGALTNPPVKRPPLDVIEQMVLSRKTHLSRAVLSSYGPSPTSCTSPTNSSASLGACSMAASRPACTINACFCGACGIDGIDGTSLNPKTETAEPDRISFASIN